MNKDIARQLLELEQAVTRTRELANSFTSRVDCERRRVDAVAARLIGLQATLSLANDEVAKIRADLEGSVAVF